MIKKLNADFFVSQPVATKELLDILCDILSLGDQHKAIISGSGNKCGLTQ